MSLVALHSEMSAASVVGTARETGVASVTQIRPMIARKIGE
eukprot:COSAG05_NODE_522_length_9020_cov_18.531891_4_plen_41_part_00